MKTDNFIGIFEGVFDSEFCRSAIDYFEAMKAQGFAVNRQDNESAPKSKKDDETVFTHFESSILLDGTRYLNAHLNNVIFKQCYPEYVEEFSILKDFETHGSYYSRLQKTEIGGGYHMWHCENSARIASGRILAWMVYLNDVEEGGETEFLYLHKRIKPKAGTLVLWPAGLTHTHRGNPPISNTKYAITGWIEF